MNRAELTLTGLFCVTWVAALAAHLGLLPLAGSLDLDLYRFFSLAGVLGWLTGNVFVYRAAGLDAALRRRFALIYLVGPPSLLYLLRALAAESHQRAAPLVPFYAFAVFGLFFLVPLTLRATRRPRA